MRKLVLAVALLTGAVGVVGCAPMRQAPAQTVGNLVANASQANDKKMADDLVKQLLLLYPPASTRFNLEQSTPDYFGSYLVDSLRAKGYAVLEFKPESKSSVTAAAASEPVSAATAGLSLSYIIDQVDQSAGVDMFRLKVVINHQQSLDRVYQIADGALYPAGYWVRKE